ncbi:hypothetical protein MU582_03350 [Nocardioidaceae bacterium SCSIO 66511]|nr:hypothetical protein MU582_03350 [Nocardioidaceae bacterium SCSIO 66511]
MTTEIVRIRPAKLRISLWLLAAGWLIVKVARIVGWLLLRPVRLVALGLGGLLGWSLSSYGLPLLAGLVLFGLAGLGLWAWRRPEAFRQRVVWRLHGRLRRFRLRRRWDGVIAGCGLTGKDPDGSVVFPSVGSVVSSPSMDRFLTRIPAGQTIGDWTAKADALAVGLNAESCRIRTPGRRAGVMPWTRRRGFERRVVRVELIRHDVLSQPVQPFGVAESPALKRLPVALTEDGTPYRLRLLGTHLLIVGQTGAGKGSVLWSIVNHVAPGISSGLVRVVGFDPKFNELTMGAPLFHQLYDGDGSVMADGLERLVAVNDERKKAMRGRSRLHVPTVDEPFYLVLVDELAALIAYMADKAAKKRIEAALSTLLTQGRAQAITVVGAVQDPRKEILSMRDLFPSRVALSLRTSEQVDMVLGDGARERGALCDQIPLALPGTGYAVVDGVPDPVRLRFPFTSDEQIRALAAAHPAPRDAEVIDLDARRDTSSSDTDVDAEQTETDDAQAEEGEAS